MKDYLAKDLFDDVKVFDIKELPPEKRYNKYGDLLINGTELPDDLLDLMYSTFNTTFEIPRRGQLIKARVIGLGESQALIELNGKTTTSINLEKEPEEYRKNLKIGQMVDAVVMKDYDEGVKSKSDIVLSLEKAAGVILYNEILESIKAFDYEKKDEQWLIDNTEKFCQDKAIYNAIMDSIKIIDGQKFESHLAGAESKGVDFLRPITPESINIVSVKSNKTQASLARNNTVHLRGKELDAYYDAIHKQSIDKIFQDIAELKDPYATHQRNALYKMLMNDRKTQASGDFNYAESQSGIETLWAELGGEPSMFPRSWENMIKSKYIDKEIAKKINGGQGVLQADLKNELKNTIVVNSEVFQYGEARIGDVNKNKLINPDRITLIKRNETIKDDLMSLSGNKQFALLHRELKQLRQHELNTL